MKARRLRASWTNKRAKAATTPMTATCPAWLELDRDRGQFVIHEQRARVVRRVFADLLAGRGRHSIVEALNREGVPVFGRGKRWHPSYVQKLLDSPAVVGTLIPYTEDYKDGKRVRTPSEAVEGYYPAIIDRETFDRAHALLEAKGSSQRGKHAGKNVQSIFGGIATCGACGASVTRICKGKSKTGNVWEYLVCSRAKSGGDCDYRLVPYGIIEASFLAQVAALFGDAPAGDRADSMDAELSRAEAALSETKERIGRLVRSVEEGGSVSESRRIRELEASQDALEKERDALASQLGDIIGPLVQRRRDDLEATLRADPLDRSRANALMRLVFEAAVVDLEARTLTMKWRTGGESVVVCGFPTEPRTSGAIPKPPTDRRTREATQSTE